MIVFTKGDDLNGLLRRLEDPGHTKWETGNISQKVKEKYGNKSDIESLVRYLKNLPHKIISHMNEVPKGLNRSILSKYFPKSKPGTGGGPGPGPGPEPNPPPTPIPSFQDFHYLPHKKGDGFSLTLKNTNNHPHKIAISVAYGTNIGNPFKNYEKSDFTFKENIRLFHKGGKELSSSTNCVDYEITSKDFKVSFSGFDPDRELKIDVKTKDS